MKQFTVFASKLRIKALLCCSAAVLLTACGGNVDGVGDQQLATAAGVTSDAGAAATASAVPAAAPEAAVEATAEAAPAASIEAAPAASIEAAAPAAGTEAADTGAAPAANTAGTTGQAAEAASSAFELTGYDSNPLAPQTEQQNAGANAPAPIKQ